jgi:hypothetical protein
MKGTERIPIVRKAGITIYGRIVGSGGKLGNYEVISENGGHEGHFAQFSLAEDRFNYLKSLKERKKG